MTITTPPQTASAARADVAPSRFDAVKRIAPGLAFATGFALAAFALRWLPGVTVFSPLILAIVLGMIWRNTLGTPRWADAGLAFSMRRLLRAAIVLLGLQLTIGQVIAVGFGGLITIIVGTAATFMMTVWLGRLMGVERGLTELLAAGTSICGASAIIATNTVTRAPDEDVAYSLASITLYGTIAMFVYPLLTVILGLDPRHYGLWTGASVHEVAQVVAAAFQDGQQAGEFGTIVKLARVMLLGPMVFALGYFAMRRGAREGDGVKVPAPWFVLGFIALVVFNSILPVPAVAKPWVVLLTTFLMTVALAALGLETDIRKLHAKGLRPLALGGLSTLFIAALTLALVKTIG